MADWPTIASLATAGGTLVLAAATFAAVRSANRAARTAERSLLAGLRPFLTAARLQDPTQKVFWQDQHYAHLPGGRAVIEEADGVIYLAAALRNAGRGVAVLHGWRVVSEWLLGRQEHPPLEAFRTLTRDLYIPAGDIGFWQGAIRDLADPDHQPVLTSLRNHEAMTIDVLYGDNEGGQRTIVRFAVTPIGDGGYLCAPAHYWNLDQPDPR
jgi:hypothetical protein